MQLSVIVVNYNVKYFLEQCLYSLQDAIADIDAEVIVVDNNGTDNSIAYLQPAFYNITFIANTQNTGFARANNQALRQAKGRYILFLNPDTLLPKDAIKACLRFMDNNQDAGALGIRMLDGSGKFLPESKRAFPSPLTSLFKLFGLTALFPSSKLFGRYYLGHLPANKNCRADVLAGAFMLVQKQVLDTSGCFDEAFFMYGEDIDLSYRIQQAGWNNYYFADSCIIHFKGESTKKGSLNYVRMFYQAMYIFVKKHYSAGKAGFFQFFIKFAIWLRAGISAAGSFISWIGLPVLDMLLTLSSIVAVALFWEQVVKPGIIYPQKVVWIVIPAFSIAFIAAAAVAGLYDKWYKPRNTAFALTMAILVNLAIYALFSEDYRFSRGVILFGGISASAAIVALRFLLVKTGLLEVPDEKSELKRTLICGNENSYERVVKLMNIAGRGERVLGRIGFSTLEPNIAGVFSNLENVLHTIPAKEIVFCINEELTLASAITFMQTTKASIRYKFHYVNSNSIIGSDSSQTSGEILSGNEHFALADPLNRRWKKIIDILIALWLLLTYPANLLIVKKPAGIFKNCWRVITGKKTWVGYSAYNHKLPKVPVAIITSNGMPAQQKTDENSALTLADYWYAKDYDLLTDIKIIGKAYRHLGG